ncbi:MAG TPA: hypothetical protein VL493_10375 [Candidatus Saccharimonadales bacterium]|jgi:spermidine synthase|nr:hypothetical protein [Candidatus Saccharimonadales bacterium]
MRIELMNPASRSASHEAAVERMAVFALSAAALLFQFAQTRLFSATLGYHLSFLVVSGALLGVALGGTAAALVDDRTRRPRSDVLAISAGTAVLVSLFVNTQLDSRASGLATATAVAYVVGVFPMLLVSWVIVRTLRERPRSSGAIYASDLAGAAVGGLLGYGLLGLLGDQGLHGLAAGLCLVAAAVLRNDGARARLFFRASVVALAALVVVVLAVWGENLAPPHPGPLKGLADIAGVSVRDYSRWDPLARIDVESPASSASSWVFLVSRPSDATPIQAKALYLDMGAETYILKDGQQADTSVLDHSILSAPYELAGRSTALVIGPGGGLDVNMALHKGMTSVVAVEVNRTIADVMQTRYASFSGGVYEDPRVNLVVDEARSFVRRSADRYDVIVMTVVDSGAALQSGAYALSENYLYTQEALSDYVSHLTPGGVVAIGRWYPFEVARTYQIAMSSLRGLGQDHPEAQLAVLRDGGFGLVLIGQRAFTAEQVDRLRQFALSNGFELVTDSVRAAAAAAPDAPATDDRPYFFDTVPFGSALDGQAGLSLGYGVLIVAFVLAALLAVAGALMPLYRRARERSGRIVPHGTMVAVALGAGFIASELVVLQRLTLYLGQPSLALALGIAALLGGAAVGSALATRLTAGVRGAAAASAIVLTVVLFGLPIVTGISLAAPLGLRVLIAIVAAAVVGVPLGTVFPKLIGTVSGHGGVLVSWIWAINGTASVLGAIVGSGVALAAGFTTLGVVAVGCYILASLAAEGAGLPAHDQVRDRVIQTSSAR